MGASLIRRQSERYCYFYYYFYYYYYCNHCHHYHYFLNISFICPSLICLSFICLPGKGTIIDSGTTDTYLPKQLADDFNKAVQDIVGFKIPTGAFSLPPGLLHPSLYLLIYPYIHLLHPSIYSSINLFIHPSIHPSIHQTMMMMTMNDDNDDDDDINNNNNNDDDDARNDCGEV